MVEGRLSVRTYLDNSQRERYALEVSGSDFVLLGSKMGNEDQQDASSFQRKTAPDTNAAPASPVSSPVANNGQAEEDDLPF